jgi:hypothetical protein
VKEKKTNCCNTSWIKDQDENPLVLKDWGAECSNCKAVYTWDAGLYCDKCGCTELLCGNGGPSGCLSENNK